LKPSQSGALRLILGILLAVSACYYFSYPGVDTDLWGHLFFGKEILRGSALPRQNLYSYTAPGFPWVNHEWLAEVLFYAVFRILGSPGLILFKLAVGCGVVWVVNRTIRATVASPIIRALTLVWIMAVLSPGFNVRPQIFTFLLLAALVHLLRVQEESGGFVLYAAPALIALWVNLHGGVVAGLASLAFFTLWSVCRSATDANTRGGRLIRVALPLGLCLVATCLNPYGADLPAFLVRDLALERPISEWQPILLLDGSFLEFKLALLLVLVTSLRREVRWRWEAQLSLLVGLAALYQQRHTPLFAILAAPILGAGIEDAWRRIGERAARRVRPSGGRGALAAGLLTLALVQAISIGRLHLRYRFRIALSPLEYPVQAADFLRRNGVKGNLAVPFDWGEYLLWKLSPEIRVSIDGRFTTAYPEEVIRDVWEWSEGQKGWRALLERYPTDLAITRSAFPVTSLLLADPEWINIYSDPTAFVFVRESPSQQDLLDRSRSRQLLPPGPLVIRFPG
jgi:hypothetical protein